MRFQGSNAFWSTADTQITDAGVAEMQAIALSPLGPTPDAFARPPFTAIPGSRSHDK